MLQALAISHHIGVTLKLVRPLSTVVTAVVLQAVAVKIMRHQDAGTNHWPAIVTVTVAVQPSAAVKRVALHGAVVMHVELHAVAVMHARLCTAARMHVALHTVAIKPLTLHTVAGSVGQHAAIVSAGLHAIAATVGLHAVVVSAGLHVVTIRPVLLHAVAARHDVLHTAALKHHREPNNQTAEGDNVDTRNSPGDASLLRRGPWATPRLGTRNFIFPYTIHIAGRRASRVNIDLS